MKPHVLIAEDEENLANALELNLRMEGYEVTVCRTGTDALGEFSSQPEKFDLALLDVMMPGLTGFDLCEQFRQKRPALPVIFLTARGEVDDRRLGLQTQVLAGVADDPNAINGGIEIEAESRSR